MNFVVKRVYIRNNLGDCRQDGHNPLLGPKCTAAGAGLFIGLFVDREKSAGYRGLLDRSYLEKWNRHFLQYNRNGNHLPLFWTKYLVCLITAERMTKVNSCVNSFT